VLVTGNIMKKQVEHTRGLAELFSGIGNGEDGGQHRVFSVYGWLTVVGGFSYDCP